MKKLIFASVMALAFTGLVYTPTLRAQDDQITIKDPAEFNSYQMATTQADPKAKAVALEGFLQTYPQSVVKKDVLVLLVRTYQGLGDLDKILSAANRLLQVDPSNLPAIYISVYIKKGQCAKTSDAQTCDDTAALAQRGLPLTTKPAKTPDDEWKSLTSAAFPLFHSTIALDDVLSKKDFKAAIAEYRTELMLYPADQTTNGPGLVDTLQLGEAYSKQEAVDAKALKVDAAAAAAATDPDAKAKATADAKAAKDADDADQTQAIWFYSRAWSFAPANFKGQIEPKIEYWYNKYHGTADGPDAIKKQIDAIKAQSTGSLFPPASYTVTPAPTPDQIAHSVIVSTPDLTKLNLGDKEFILANGTPEDANKLWALLKDQLTPVPGVVIEATSTVIKLAVTDDAKALKIPDFIVTLKTALTEKDVPAAGYVYGLAGKGEAELDATYDSFKQVPATDTVAQTAQIYLKDASIQAKKATAPAHKPAAGHHTAPAAH